MTEHSDIDRDEIASALLDGELDDDRSTVGATEDAEVSARVAQFRAVSEQLRDPVEALSAEQRQSMLSAALAAGARADQPVVADLTKVRRARKRVWLPPPAIAAAVVLVVALVGIGLIAVGRGSDRSTDNASAVETSAERDGDGAATVSPQAPSADASAGERAPTEEIPALGRFANAGAVRVALATVDPSTLQQPAGTSPGFEDTVGAAPGDPATTAANTPESRSDVATAAIDRCDGVVKSSDPTLGARLAVAAAKVSGRPALIYSHPVGDRSAGGVPAKRLTVTDAESCGILLAIQR